MSRFMMDAFFTSSSFPTLKWYWDDKSPRVHIYCSDMWEYNFIPDIIDTDTKSHLYKYHKDPKIRILREREDTIMIEKNI